MKKSIIYTCLFGLGALTLGSCSDPMEEIEHLVYGRVFSPTDLEAKNVKESSATVQWNASQGAGGYKVEVFEDDSLSFAGSPIRSVPLTASTTSYDLSGLVYDTQYSVRVVANDSTDSSRDSKASTVYFRTSAQQIFSTPKEVDIADRSVILSWKEGQTDVTRIDVLDEAGKVVTSHNITADEKEAFKAEVTGLSPETKYTAKLYFINDKNVQKERGSKTFTTIVDLNGAKVLRPTDDIQEAVNNAVDGDVFALYGGTYVVKSSSDGVDAGSISVSKNITIKGIFPTNVPTINGRFELQDGATLTINQVNLDGKGTSGDQCFNVKGTSIGGIEINNAEIKNYTKGVHYINVAAKIPYVKYVNCLIHDITCEGGDMFDCRKGCMENFTLSKSTVYNSCAERDFIRFDDASSAFSGATPVVTVDQCTIDAASNTSGKRLLYVRFVGSSINWTNNIVTNTVAKWSNQSKTAVPNFGNNNVYYGCANLNVLDGTDAGKTNLFIDEQATVLDPKYKNAASGNFTLGNESVSKLKVGDPRWY